MFSPYYAAARRRGAAEALDHCAVNVALYRRDGSKRWAMTERSRRAVDRGPQHLAIGPSALAWHGDALRIDLDEITAPWPSRLRGRITLHPACTHRHTVALDEAGLHRWNPVAPVSHVEVALTHPGLRWAGPAYFDSNRGERPLEQDFTSWHWSRAHLTGSAAAVSSARPAASSSHPPGAQAAGARSTLADLSGRHRTAVLYDVTRRVGAPLALALGFDGHGRIEPFEAPPHAALARTGWRVSRETRCDADATPRVRQTLEDGPFYARSLVDTRLGGTPAVAVHESLSLDRFSARWVQTLLPFRMPRRG